MRKYWHLFFSFRGEVKRLDYLVGRIVGLLILFLAGILIFLPANLLKPLFNTQLRDIVNVCKLITAGSYLMGFILALMAIVSILALDIKRLRNIGLSVWLILIRFLPIASFVLGILLFTLPTKDSASNQSIRNV